jgi:hypothetical protein|tara:strand:- start:502 stop:792 length:291 start_codon:yes stop_codon:yes gene_type:complete
MKIKYSKGKRMLKEYKYYEEIPTDIQQSICEGNGVDDVRKVSLKDINSFYQGLDEWHKRNPTTLVNQQLILERLDQLDQAIREIQSQVQQLYDRLV